MMTILIFTIALAAYIWIGYPLLLVAVSCFLTRPIRRNGQAPKPAVSLILAVHNEEAQIRTKLQNCLDLEYPPERLEIIVASDDSTDATEKIVEHFAARDGRIRLIRSAGRAGKSGVQNLAAYHACGEVIFFSDASTRMPADALDIAIEPFTDPEVGLVSLAVHFGDQKTSVAKGQGFYWRYEMFLRSAESDLGILAVSSGQALAVRKKLFRALPPCYGDDCIIPLDVRLQGYRVVHERRTTVFDEMPNSIKGEFRARVRMTTRNWTGTIARPALLNPLRYPFTAWGLVSHKLLRWLTPILLAASLIANTMLVAHNQALTMWLLQLTFYACAAVGWWRSRRHLPAWIFGYAFSFCLANLGFLVGIWRALRNHRIVAYQVAE